MPESESLQLKVFVCRNALTDDLRRTGLEELLPVEHLHAEQVPCLGKVDPRYLLRNFEEGCDGVCLIGCPVGKCLTMDGNLRAQRRAEYVRGILREIGIKGERVFLFLREPMDEAAAKETMREFLERVRSFGASELRKGKSSQKL